MQRRGAQLSNAHRNTLGTLIELYSLGILNRAYSKTRMRIDTHMNLMVVLRLHGAS